MSLLEVQDLTVVFDTPDGKLTAVRGLDFSLEEGSTLGVVGESGSGKSAAMLATLGLSGGHVSGHAVFDGRDLLGLSAAELRAVRGRQISMIFQDPLSSLHPYYRIGWQLVEAIRAHENVSAAAARHRAVEMLEHVGIPEPDRRFSAYPHEFSGGMRQRVMIAMALLLRPRVLIADEPTTALDVTVQAQILVLIRELQAETGMAVVLITHDLGVVADLADEVVVMYAGKAVEHAPHRDLYHRTHHPYTRGLLRSIPNATAAGRRLEPITGQPPSLLHVPSGCPFHPRCPFAFDRCPHEEPPLMHVDAAHGSACWLPGGLLGTSTAVDAARLAFTREHDRSAS